MRSLAPLFLSGFGILARVWAVETAPSSLQERQSATTSVPAPPVDIGYGVYQGYYNDTSRLNIYKGYVDQRIPSMELLN